MSFNLDSIMNDIHKVVADANQEGSVMHAWVQILTTFFSDPIGQFMPLINATGDMFTPLFSVIGDVSDINTDFFKFVVMAPYNAVMKLLSLVGIGIVAEEKAAPNAAPSADELARIAAQAAAEIAANEPQPVPAEVP